MPGSPLFFPSHVSHMDVTETPADPPSPKGYALFDLDHTLLPFDTQALFCNFVIRREPWRIIYLL
jgi:hypothetical protein